MICIDYPCDRCKNAFEEMLDGWNTACKAFPEGIPVKFLKIDVTKLAECANGYKFEEGPRGS
jgi:hypothetical protein